MDDAIASLRSEMSSLRAKVDSFDSMIAELSSVTLELDRHRTSIKTLQAAVVQHHEDIKLCMIAADRAERALRGAAESLGALRELFGTNLAKTTE